MYHRSWILLVCVICCSQVQGADANSTENGIKLALSKVFNLQKLAEQHIQYCAALFEDMRQDLHQTYQHWYDRNYQVINKLESKFHTFAIDRQALPHSATLGPLLPMDELRTHKPTAQKNYCFDVMVFLDTERSDIKNLLLVEYLLLFPTQTPSPK